jgi:transposase
LRFVITRGETHDAKTFPHLIDWHQPPLAIIADKAYDTRAIRRAAADEGALAVIPSKRTARNPIPHDETLYAMRNIIERFFCAMKDMRRLSVRFEKLARNLLSMLHIYAIRTWLK